MRKFYFFFIIALMLTGCKHHKQEISPVTPQQENLSQLAAIYPELAESYKQWDQVYMPLTASLLSPSQKSISGRINMKRGQWIHISLRVLGMEVVTIYIDQSEAWLVDRMHRQYVRESLERLLAKYPLTISDVQDCFLGQLFPPDRDFLADNIIASATESKPKLLGALLMAKVSGPEVQVSYSNHTDSPAGMIAQTMRVDVTGLKRDIIASLAWDLNRAEWDAQTPLKFKQPNDTYQQVDAKSFLK